MVLCMTDCRGMSAPRPGADFDPELHQPAAVDAALVFQWGFDYAWGYYPGFAQVLSANGAQFACRYLGGSKGLSVLEVDVLCLAGITICPIWEITGTDYVSGYNAGFSDGLAAAAELRGLGAPAGTYVWFAIDTQTSDYTAVCDYLRGCKAGTAEYIAQLYGDFGVVEAAYAAGLGRWHWQTYAWSGGQLSGHAALYQYQNAVTVGGVSCDRDKTLQDLGGPWAHFGVAPAPVFPPISPVLPVAYLTAAETEAIVAVLPVLTPGITDAQLPHWYVRRVQSVLNDVYGAVPVLLVDGVYGPSSQAAVKILIQQRYGLAQDAIVGKATWTVLVTAST